MAFSTNPSLLGATILCVHALSTTKAGYMEDVKVWWCEDMRDGGFKGYFTSSNVHNTEYNISNWDINERKTHKHTYVHVPFIVYIYKNKKEKYNRENVVL